MNDTAPGGAHSGIENPFTKEVGEFAKELLEEWKVPGVSAAFVTENQVFTAVRFRPIWAMRLCDLRESLFRPMDMRLFQIHPPRRRHFGLGRLSPKLSQQRF